MHSCRCRVQTRKDASRHSERIHGHTQTKSKEENKTRIKSTELFCSSLNLYEHECEDMLLFLYNVHVIVLRSLFISDYNLA